MLNKIKLLIKTSRPLSYFLVVVFVAGMYDAKASFDLISIIQLISLTFPAALFSNGINDIFDYESDKINPRKNLQKGELKYGQTLSKKNHKFVYIASFTSGLFVVFISFLSGSIVNIFLITLAFIFSYFYSAPPLRLKNYPPFDIISIIIPFVVYYLIGFNYGKDILEISYTELVNLLCWSLGVVGFVTLSNINDYKADKESGVKNTVTRLGLKLNSWIVFISFFLASVFVNLEFKPLQYYIYFVTVLYFSLVIKSTPKQAKRLLKITIVTYLPIIILYVFSLR